MITTLKPTTELPLHATSVGAPVAPMAASTVRELPEGRSSDAPRAIGVLLGLLVVLALAAWAYLMLRSGDYSGIIDLTGSIAR